MSNENDLRTLNPETATVIARQLLRSYQMSGLQNLPKPQGRNDFGFVDQPEENQVVQPATLANKTNVETLSSPAIVENVADTTNRGFSHEVVESYESAPVAAEKRSTLLQQIESEVSQCTQCAELSACRKNTVFGVGHPQPQLVFLGEGPGADEDRQGEPFVGAAGQLLNRIIEACKMKREDVYILNTVKCRPPGNRNPADDELSNCWPYAVRQLEILQPQFICCLGSVAAKTLLQTRQSIGRMRGQFFKFRGSQVIVTYHPAYLLRNPNAKRQVWDDMKLLLTAMGKQL